MARTESTQIMKLGTVAPDFLLPDTVSGRMTSLNDCRGQVGTVVMFLCNHCPFVKHVASGLALLAKDYTPQGISFVGISSNDAVNYPEDAPELMKREAELQGYGFPYLYDESQDVARAYSAACTPDFYVFDGDLRCVYRGQMDASRPQSGIPVTGHDIRGALDALLAGLTPDPHQIPSLGCNIKWKPEEAEEAPVERGLERG